MKKNLVINFSIAILLAGGISIFAPLIRPAPAQPQGVTNKRQGSYVYSVLLGKTDTNVRGNVSWFDTRGKNLGSDLPMILSNLSKQGWELAAVGDVAFDSKAEVIIRHSAPESKL